MQLLDCFSLCLQSCPSPRQSAGGSEHCSPRTVRQPMHSFGSKEREGSFMVALKHGLLGFACGFGTSPHLMTLPSTRLTMVPTKASAAEVLVCARERAHEHAAAGRQAGRHARTQRDQRTGTDFFFWFGGERAQKVGQSKNENPRPRTASGGLEAGAHTARLQVNDLATSFFCKPWPLFQMECFFDPKKPSGVLLAVGGLQAFQTPNPVWHLAGPGVCWRLCLP